MVGGKYWPIPGPAKSAFQRAPASLPTATTILRYHLDQLHFGGEFTDGII
jgi:hypothetical protein